MPFDSTRMAYGGFDVLVDLAQRYQGGSVM